MQPQLTTAFPFVILAFYVPDSQSSLLYGFHSSQRDVIFFCGVFPTLDLPGMLLRFGQFVAWTNEHLHGAVTSRLIPSLSTFSQGSAFLLRFQYHVRSRTLVTPVTRVVCPACQPFLPLACLNFQSREGRERARQNFDIRSIRKCSGR